jgi:hypothetical protein
MTSAALLEPPSPIASLRDRLFADAGLQDRLAAIDDRDEFLAAASAVAAESGIAIDGALLDEALRPGPVGRIPHAVPPAASGGWPGRHWLPIGLASGIDGPTVEWAHFGGARLAEPFFEDSAHRARRRPLNRLLRWTTPLATLASETPRGGGATPAGLIFHMSRCGSTLVAQMIAAMTTSVVVSEAPVLDAVLQHGRAALPEPERVAMLRAIVGALGRDRCGTGGPFVVKLDSWHSLALPLFRRAFPETPWIFLHRDPHAVIASHRRMPGLQMIGGAPAPPDRRIAHVLARVCGAALAHRSLGGGRFVDYALLPDAVERLILPHFGIVPDAQDRAAMRQAATRDAKTPALAFTRDAEDRHTPAAEDIGRHGGGSALAGIRRRLDAVRREART